MNPARSVNGVPSTFSVGATQSRSATCITVTLTIETVLPPGPEQFNEYVALSFNGPVDSVPDVAFIPDHAPDAEHVSVSIDCQFRVLDPPFSTTNGLAVSVVVGSTVVTATDTDCVSVPPAPLQVSEKLADVVKGTVVSLPLDGRKPLQSPLAVQDETSPTAFQDSCTASPGLTVALLADKDTTTASGAPTVMLTLSLAVPPGPSQVMSYPAASVLGNTHDAACVHIDPDRSATVPINTVPSAPM